MGVKLSDLTTESSPASNDIIMIADPTTGLARKITVSALKTYMDGLGGGGDTTAPTIVSATASTASTITIVFSESVTVTTAGWSFKRNGTNWAISSVAGSGSTWTFTMGSSGASSDTILRSYNSTTGSTVDSSSNELVTFTDSAVTNSIPGGYDADAQAYFDVLSASTTGFRDATDALVAGLKTDSIWTKIDALYLFRHGANASAANHKWNAKNPLDTDGAFRLVFTGCTHNGTGLSGNGTTDYADTKFNPSTAAAANSIALGAWNNNSGTANGSMIGCDDGAADYTDVQYSTLAWYSFINRPNAGEFATDPEADNSGFVAGSRTSSTSNKLWKNAAQIGSTATTANSGAMPNKTITLLARNSSSVGAFFAGELACAFIAEGLNDTELGNLYSRLNTWRSAT